MANRHKNAIQCRCPKCEKVYWKVVKNWKGRGMPRIFCGCSSLHRNIGDVHMYKRGSITTLYKGKS